MNNLLEQMAELDRELNENPDNGSYIPLDILSLFNEYGMTYKAENHFVGKVDHFLGKISAPAWDNKHVFETDLAYMLMQRLGELLPKMNVKLYSHFEHGWYYYEFWREKDSEEM